MLHNKLEDGARLIAYSICAPDGKTDKGAGTAYGLLGLRVSLWADRAGRDINSIQPLFVGKTISEAHNVFNQLQKAQQRLDTMCD